MKKKNSSLTMWDQAGRLTVNVDKNIQLICQAVLEPLKWWHSFAALLSWTVTD